MVNDFITPFKTILPSVVSSATDRAQIVVTVSLEAVTSNGGDLSANLANLEGLAHLEGGRRH